MLLNNHRWSSRRGFTLVEMLVSCALAVGLMWLLAESFKMGLDFTRHARSTGQMMGQLDGVGAVMARDIQAEHFLPDENLPNRGVRLSDQRLDRLSNASPSLGWTPPKGGFFRIISRPSFTEAVDADGFAVNSATDHALHFTAVLPANDRNPFSVNSPAGSAVSYQSRAAEIAYFLVDSGQRTAPGPTGRQLYHFVRRQRLAALTDDERSALQPAVADVDVIAGNGTNVYSLIDLMNPAYRLQVNPTAVPGATNSPLMFPITNNRYGEDLLLSNVLSFEVLVDWSPNIAGMPNCNAAPRPFATNSESPFDYLAINTGQNTLGAGVFDTWHNVPNWNTGLIVAPVVPNVSKLPLAVRVKQIQVTVRMWDPKTKQSRQNTWKFSM